jgi:peptidoglycan/LPS O-acetylase OafA/YrhL
VFDLTKKTYLPELDGLRATAIFLVLITHVRSAQGTEFFGSVGVGMFFVLSGYLITSIALAEEIKKGAISLVGFYVRRSFRIFPLYYLVLGIYCFLILGLNLFPVKHVPLKEALPFYLVYLQEIPYFRTAQGASLPFYQSWSLGIEEKFYLVWPLICFVALRYKAAWRIPAVAALAVACSLNPYTRPYVSILFGCGLALSLPIESVRKLGERTAAIGIWIVAALLLALHLAPSQFWRWEMATSLHALVFTFFLGFLVIGDNYFKKALSTAPLVFVGRMSYGIYLVHLLCLGMLRTKIPGHNTWLMLFATLGLSLAVATALHYTLEQPFIRFGRQFAKKITSAESTPLFAAVDSNSQA